LPLAPITAIIVVLAFFEQSTLKLARSSDSRCCERDVLVEPKHVGRLVRLLDGGQALVVIAAGGPNEPFVVLAGSREVQVGLARRAVTETETNIVLLDGLIG
jgi:ferric-dicitrate binding protein FerR (iron transport regulator)